MRLQLRAVLALVGIAAGVIGVQMYIGVTQDVSIIGVDSIGEWLETVDIALCLL